MEGGAKRRIFAIGNYLNQRLLKPFHDWWITLIGKIPMDGTFNQTKPLDRLVGKMHLYSYDLKSATDRWPLLIMYKMIEFLFDREFAKRFRVRGMSRDLSPISIKALKNFFNPYVLIAIDGIYSVRRFSTLCRIGGMGYKGLSNLDKKRPKRFEQVWCMRIKKNFPSMEWWLGRGYPLDPYLKGVMVDYLRL